MQPMQFAHEATPPTVSATSSPVVALPVQVQKPWLPLKIWLHPPSASAGVPNWLNRMVKFATEASAGSLGAGSAACLKAASNFACGGAHVSE